MAIIYFVGVPGSVLTTVLAKQGVIFGVTVHGWVGMLSGVCVAGLVLYLGFGLWCLQEMARKIAIWLNVYTLGNLWLYIFTPGAQEVAKATAERTAAWMGTSAAGQLSTSPIGMLPTAIGGTISAVLYIWFLIKRKSAFVKPKISSSAST